MSNTHSNLPDIEDKAISIKEIAKDLNVSIATVRNWIQEDLLNETDGKVSKQDFELLKSTKLKSRANKQHKDSHNHSALANEIQSYLDNGLKGDEISNKYEEKLSESYKNSEGIFYTMPYIVSDMLNGIDSFDDKTFLDPCCGSGNFIIEAIRKGVKPENIYGFDIDPIAIKIAQRRFFELTGKENDNIICADFLAIANNYNKKFDLIFTNPPWGKKLQKKEKERLSKIYHSGNSSDTSALFYFACLHVLKEKGHIGFLLPESFFNIGIFEDARKSLLQLQVNRLIDYGKPFKELMTKAKAFVATNIHSKANSTVSCETYKGDVFYRKQDGFVNIPKHIFNFDITESENDIIRHVYTFAHITLKDNANWALGIVTGNNNKFCIKTPGPNYVKVYRGKDILPNSVTDSGLYIEQSLKNCQQVAPLEFYKAKDKIIYRFISNKIVCFHDTEQRYILNSANLFILKTGFPISYKQLTDLLNSNFMNWLFQSIFRTHKVLRGDLEALPIWCEYFNTNKIFSEESLLNYLKIEKQDKSYRIKK